MKIFCAVWVLIAIRSATSIAADVSMEKSASGVDVKARSYTAHIASDGSLAKLMAGNESLIAPLNGITNGLSLFQRDLLPLKLVGADGVTCQASAAAGNVRYEFGSDGIQLDVTNRSPAPLSILICFDRAVESVSREKDHLDRVPITTQCTTTTWFAGGSKLRISDGDRLWGPWNGAQAWEAVVPANGKRHVMLEIAKTSADELKAIASLPPIKESSHPREVSVITLWSPLDYQVTQRFSRMQGKLALRGRAAVPFDRIEIRLSGKDLTGIDLPSTWQEIPSTPPTGSFSGEPIEPSGGWYKLELRAKKGERIVAQTTVTHVGIGEVFIGCGQSNSTSYGETRQKTTSGMVSTFSGDDWRLADDPQPGAMDKGSGGSFWPAFGDAMYEKYRVPIGVSVTGRGATGVQEWKPDSPLFDHLLFRILKFGPGGFRAVLWHQGESDANQTSPRQSTPPDVYFRALEEVIVTTRRKAGCEIPWFVANATYHSASDPECPAIRWAQRELWTSGIAMEGPDTDALGPEFRAQKGRSVHFSEKGLQAHGKLWAEKVGEYLDQQLNR